MTEPRVRLRDVTLADADLLDAWDAAPDVRGEFNDFGMPPSPAPRDVMATGPLRNEHNGMLIVELIADGTPIGSVSWHRVMNGPNPESATWNIGISLVPAARGHGYGTDAQRQVADYLFATTEVNRVEAATDVENLPEQRSLEKAGFQREGVARGSQFRAGSYHDLVVYSRLRDD
ncbi:MAG: GNAT family N-acetyltransferase [Chloroflexota bacterium]|nr:GNAT family N-acetyltransferase [Chloroflexota bacterium]